MGQNLFNSVKMTRPKNNVFDLSHDVKMSCDMGFLNPTLAMEAVPGDKFNIGCDSLIRFSPLVSPVMHRMDVTMHYFFVPNRLLWPGWEDFITNTPTAGLLPAHPFIQVKDDGTNYTPLMDYLGIPTPPVPATGTSENVNALPFAAYQMIYNEYYRDQNLINEVPFSLVDGDNSANGDLTQLRKRAWEHDYFTASLPFAQKGAAVSIPLGNVVLDSTATAAGKILDAATHGVTGAGSLASAAISSDLETIIGGTHTPSVYDPNGTLNVDPTTINDLRRAFRLQEWLEKAARGGSRYIENILAHFGVKSSDKRLQRPEYITGSKSPVIISETLSTAETTTAPQANMAGHAFSANTGRFGDYYCEEHGYIIGIMSVMPKTAYQQGIAKHFLKTEDPFQYYWPSFANIGEQEVLLREIYAFDPNNKDTFGYIPRYAEYKYMPSRVAGDFRNSLDFWHMGRIFASAPALNQSFVECDPTTRIFAVTGPTNHLYCHVLHKIRAVRPMPKFGTPSF